MAQPLTDSRSVFHFSELRQSLRIPAALAAIALPLVFSGCKPPDPASKGPTGNIASDAVQQYGQNVHNSLEAGKRTQCSSNLSQLRQALQMQKMSGEPAPASLRDLGAQLTSIQTCPTSNQPYQYDPAAGRVWCATEGHNRL